LGAQDSVKFRFYFIYGPVPVKGLTGTRNWDQAPKSFWVTTLAKFLVTGTSKFELMSTVMDRTSQSSGLVFLLIIPVYFQVSVGAGGIINDCWRIFMVCHNVIMLLYDMMLRPTILFQGFPVQNPVDEFSSYYF